VNNINIPINSDFLLVANIIASPLPTAVYKRPESLHPKQAAIRVLP
jgi:hypothetical protein